jgi:hypothetical protein
MVRRRTIPLAALALAASVAAVAPAAAAGTAAAGPHSQRVVTVRGLAQGGGRLRPAVTIPCTVEGPNQDLCESTNWSGYVVSGGSFSTVTASWTEAKISCTKGDGSTDMSPWVGLDGYTSNTVEQIGTSGDCVGTTSDYYAWWEMYPASPHLISKGVNPGDQFTATVSHTGTSYTLTLEDLTRHWTRIATAKLAAKNVDAEAVLEKAAPHLTQWSGPQPFTGFTIDGQPVSSYETAPYTVNQFNINIKNTTTLCDSTSGLSNSDDFSASWLNIC